jgi:serine protease AprX
MAGEPVPTNPEARIPTSPGLAERLAPDAKPRGWWTRLWANKKQRWTAIGIVLMFLVSIIAGVAYYWGHRASPQQDYVEVYITDLPANFTKLEVRLAGVYVGEPNHTLELLTPRFDLLSLQGPADALKIAAGHIPAGDHQAVRIVFASARANLNGAWISLDLPDQMLTISHDFNTQDNPSSAFLFDIDVDSSIRVEGSSLVFRPHIDAIYQHSFTTGAVQQVATGSPGVPGFGAPTFNEDSKSVPRDQKLGQPTGPLRPTPPTTAPTTSNTKISWNPPDPTPRTHTVTTTATTTNSLTLSTSPPQTEGYLPDPGDANSVPDNPTDVGGWFVRFKPTLQLVPDMVLAIQKTWDGKPGAPPELVFTFATEAAAYVFATPEQAWAMAMSPDIDYVEPDREVVLNLATSRSAIRIPQVSDPVLGLKDAQGRAIDGTGVAVGAIDIGFDGTHPDLAHYLINPAAPVLLANYKAESLFQVDLPNTDTTSGHGTHVLGILAGRGIADPTQRGVAPGAKAYGFAIGEYSTTLWPNTALDWLVQNHAKVNPPIKVVTNSWGSGNAYDPNSLTTRLIERLIDEGVTVVFSAGNSGGDGSLAATTAQCQIPKPGLICVAAFDDQGTGVRDGAIAPYTSRGRTSDPNSWPDLSAPGTYIRSARPLLAGETGIGLLDAYTALSGTSMAAPHVAGVVALMLQANPNLSPAQVESILEQSAYKFPDGGAYGPSGHHAKGHGLVDAYAAISLAKQS